MLCFLINSGNKKTSTDEFMRGLNRTQRQVLDTISFLNRRGIIEKSTNPTKDENTGLPNLNLRIRIKPKQYDYTCVRMRRKDLI